jgi:D-alanyl-D-alanine carboxypeptidase
MSLKQVSERSRETGIQLSAIALMAVTTMANSAVPGAKLAPQTLERCIASQAKQSNFSGVISVVRPAGEVTVAQGFMAAPGGAAMLREAQFNIGSAGKMWTAVAVGQLVDAGKLGLDDKIGKYVSGLTSEASAVTIRQLLTHSSGLGNFFTPDRLDFFKRMRSLAELKPLIAAEKPAFTPGKKSQYSNSGFLLLGLLIEQVSGKSYGEYLQEHLFKPAGMTGSSVIPAAAKMRALGMTNFPELDDEARAGEGAGSPLAGSATGAPPKPPAGMPRVRPNGPNDPNGPSGPMMMPPPGPLRPAMEAELMGTSAGGGFSTALDMQRFFAALLAGKLTSAKMLKELTAQQIELLPAKASLPAVYYGLGFSIAEFKGHGWIGHNGGAPGLNVATAAFAADKITAVVMTNRDPPAADLMMRKLQEMLFDGACKG